MPGPPLAQPTRPHLAQLEWTAHGTTSLDVAATLGVRLQSDAGGAIDPVQALLVAMAAASTALGLYVGYQGYRGFRRNESVPMKYLSVGLVLLTAVTYGLSFGGSIAFRYDLAPDLLRPAWQLAVRAAQLAGLACIVYSLYRKP